jgi:putative flippase GtrA
MARLPSILNRPVVKYAIAGSGTVTIDLGLLIILKQYAHIDVYVAATISYWLSLLFNFSVNKLWTFDARSNTPQHVVSYSVLIGINYLTGLGLIKVALALHGSYVVGKLIGFALTTTWNFLLYKHVIFVTERWRPELLSTKPAGEPLVKAKGKA